MALNSSRLSAIATPGMAAAATARPASGGRNVAAAHGVPVEEAAFSPFASVNDNRLLRYDEEMQPDLGRDGGSQDQATPFVYRAAMGFQVEDVEEVGPGAGPGQFLSMVLKGVGTYENNMRITTPGNVRPGSVLNYLY